MEKMTTIYYNLNEIVSKAACFPGPTKVTVLTVSPNTDRPRPVNNIFIFFLLRYKSFRKISFTLQPMCVEVGRVRVDEARDRLQTKTKHYNMIFSSVIYIMALTALF